MDLKGTFTAMITPFREEELDEAGLVQNIHAQLAAEITGLLFLGTTGEEAALSEEEKERVMEIGVKEVKGKALVLIGTGSNSTSLTIQKTKKAEALGADIALIVTPYYNKPTQEGIFRHFEAICHETKIPILVYNISGRCGVNIETETLLRIASLPNIIGVKEASGNIGQIADVIQLVRGRYPDFAVLSGDDGVTLPLIALGGGGVVSVASNLFPAQMASLVKAALRGDFGEARKYHEELMPWFRFEFIESNPIPIKEAMRLSGLPSGRCRLPLTGLMPKNQERLVHLLRNSCKNCASAY